jgi:DNA-binding MarR family transcriptional regulator
LECADQIVRLLFRTAHAIRLLMTPFFESYNLSPAQWVVLMLLKEREQLRQDPPRLVELCQCLGIRQPSLTAFVNKLELQGLVSRTAAGGEQRGRQLQLTSAGRALIRQLSPAHRRRLSTLLTVLGSAEQNELLAMLDKLHSHIENLNRAAAPASQSAAEDARGR